MLKKYLDEKNILFLNATTKDNAISSMIDFLDKNNKLIDKESFKEAIHKREKIISTGIGMGVAIPHAKLKEYSDFFLLIGIQKKKGINWTSLDGSLVRIIFMIGGPEDNQNKYLKILSNLTSVIKDHSLRKQLVKMKTAKSIKDLFLKI